jgi:hypothetical protein
MSNYNTQMHMPLTPTVKWLMIVTAAIWIAFQLIGEGYLGLPITKFFALYPGKVVE